MKQYVIMDAYQDNYHIIQVVDGKIERDKIVALYNLVGYTDALEAQGYTRAYFVPEAKNALEVAKANYMYAQDEYDKAVNNALQISDAEAKKHHALAKFLGPDDHDDFT